MIAMAKIKTTIFICVCLSHLFLRDIVAKRTDEPIADDEGKKYAFIWIFSIVNSAVGILYNSLSLYL
jgi:hypothetical protein